MPWLANGGSSPAARCEAGPRTRRDVISRRHTARPRDDAARWGHRALPPLRTRGVHPTPKNLCDSIHPAQKLFVPLCVKNSSLHHPRALPCGAMVGRHRPWELPTLPARALVPLHTRGVHAKFAHGVRPRIIPAITHAKFAPHCPWRLDTPENGATDLPPVRIWEAQTAGTCKDARRRQCDSFLS